MKRYLKIAGVVMLALVVVGAGAIAVRRPSNDRDWSWDSTRIPTARLEGDRAFISNMRNFTHRAPDQHLERWENRSFDLSKLESVWFFVVPFGSFKGPAHTFVSFGFRDSTKGTDYLAISVEVRKERGEHYHPVTGLFRAYELMYVIGDERDLIRLRANVRGDSVFMYRVATTPEKGRQLLRDMLTRANALSAEPEFYNTLTRSCTTTIVDHVNAIAPSRVPLSHKVLLPAFADELAYEIGLLARDRPFAELRRAAHIGDRSVRHSDDPHFSERIREGL